MEDEEQKFCHPNILSEYPFWLKLHEIKIISENYARKLLLKKTMAEAIHARYIFNIQSGFR